MDAITYGTLVDICSIKKDKDLVLKIFAEMRSELEPKESSKSSSNASKKDFLSFGSEEAPAKPWQPHITVFNSLFKVFLDDERIFGLFQELCKRNDPKPSLSTFTIMLDACLKFCKYDEGVQYWDDMKARFIVPDQIAFGKILDLCSDSHDFSFGNKILEEIKFSKIEVDKILQDKINKFKKIETKVRFGKDKDKEKKLPIKKTSSDKAEEDKDQGDLPPHEQQRIEKEKRKIKTREAEEKKKRYQEKAIERLKKKAQEGRKESRNKL